MKMSIISSDGTVTVTFYDSDTHSVVAEAAASNVTTAVRAALDRFDTMYQEAWAELRKCGLVADVALKSTPKGKPPCSS